MLDHTRPDTYPTDGYIRVTGATTTKPPENLMWMMAWTVEALWKEEGLCRGLVVSIDPPGPRPVGGVWRLRRSTSLVLCPRQKFGRAC